MSPSWLLERRRTAVFWQVHRSIIVNVNAIETIYRSPRGSLEFKLKERKEVLPASSSHAHLFKKAWLSMLRQRAKRPARSRRSWRNSHRIFRPSSETAAHVTPISQDGAVLDA